MVQLKCKKLLFDRFLILRTRLVALFFGEWNFYERKRLYTENSETTAARCYQVLNYYSFIDSPCCARVFIHESWTAKRFHEWENGNAEHGNYGDLHDGKQMDDKELRKVKDLEWGRAAVIATKLTSRDFATSWFIYWNDVESIVTVMPTQSTQAPVHLNYHNSTAADSTDGFINTIGMEFQRIINFINRSAYGFDFNRNKSKIDVGYEQIDDFLSAASTRIFHSVITEIAMWEN